MEHSVATDSNLATGIVQSLSSLFKDEILADFTVVVEDSTYKCHRNILGACSKFFYAMFTADMIEKKDNSARLHDIDSSVFEILLKILYTGENLVNEENVLSIWQCAHRLQIPFLVEHCENFAVSILSTENFADCSRVATILDSESVLGKIHKFILKNFIKVKDDEIFLEFSECKIKELIENDALEVNCEDDVLFFIYKWVESCPQNNCKLQSQNETNNENNDIRDVLSEAFKESQNDVTNSNGNVPELPIPNTNNIEMYKPIKNRSIHLVSLLKASRSCLASRRCLQTLYKNRLTQSDEKAQAIIFDAILYQVKGYHHGYFPPAALYRASSKFEHVGVVAHDNGSFEALSLERNKWYPMPACKEIKNKIKLALFDSTIYAIGEADGGSSSKLCVLKESSWVSIKELPGVKCFLLSHETYLYVFDSSNEEIHRMQPNSYDKNLQKLDHPREITCLEFALSLKDYILVFSRDDDGDNEETAVHVMNTLNETWHRLENLPGSANNMASFQNDGDIVYLLQNNGNLWSVASDNAEMITFHYLQKMWDDTESLRGALLYKGKLFLFLKLPWVNRVETFQSSWPGVYTVIRKWAREGYSSNFVCTVMHKLDMAKE